MYLFLDNSFLLNAYFVALQEHVFDHLFMRRDWRNLHRDERCLLPHKWILSLPTKFEPDQWNRYSHSKIIYSISARITEVRWGHKDKPTACDVSRVRSTHRFCVKHEWMSWIWVFLCFWLECLYIRIKLFTAVVPF